MKSKVFVLFMALLSFSLHLQAISWNSLTEYFSGKTTKDPTIRILILHDVKGAQLEVKGKYSLSDPYDADQTGEKSTRFKGKKRYIQALRDGLKWGESFPGVYQLKIHPESKDMTTFLNGQAYKDLIYIYDIGGTISVVNEIPLEVYVKTLLMHLDTSQLEEETLASLAIAARTNAYYQMQNSKNSYWVVDATKVNFQGSIEISPAIEKAVQNTKNMIMSLTGIYEGKPTPFAAQFNELPSSAPTKDIVPSKISVEKANQMALNNLHAAQILSQAFPGITIMLIK